MVTFEDFWAAWPAGRRVTKRQSIDQWNRMTDVERIQAIDDVQFRTRHSYRWQRPAEDGLWAIPYPFRYLRDKRFEDVKGREMVNIRAVADQAPAYVTDWCQHEPRCNSRDWHAVLVERETRPTEARR